LVLISFVYTEFAYAAKLAIKVENAFFGTNVLGIDRNQKTHEGLPNSQLFRNIATE